MNSRFVMSNILDRVKFKEKLSRFVNQNKCIHFYSNTPNFKIYKYRLKLIYKSTNR